MRKNVLCPYCRHERRGKPFRFHSLRQGLEKELLRAPLEMRRKAQGDITRLLATPAMMAADLGGEAPRCGSKQTGRVDPDVFAKDILVEAVISTITGYNAQQSST